MSILGIVLLVFFVIVSVLLILLVLAQNEEGDSLGGIFAGGSGSAFGSRSGNVLTRATTVLGALFLIISLGLALVNRSPAGSGVESAGRQLVPESGADWWQDAPAESPAEPSEAVSPAGAGPEAAQ
ncbi:MAG: preprotein translocase subunit SecG [Treponema sp.]|jgi:preprotein translocase subunit SecG|nr:preprotein translocase subunit SecG [Treponema sp.]